MTKKANNLIAKDYITRLEALELFEDSVKKLQKQYGKNIKLSKLHEMFYLKLGFNPPRDWRKPKNMEELLQAMFQAPKGVKK